MPGDQTVQQDGVLNQIFGGARACGHQAGDPHHRLGELREQRKIGAALRDRFDQVKHSKRCGQGVPRLEGSLQRMWQDRFDAVSAIGRKCANTVALEEGFDPRTEFAGFVFKERHVHGQFVPSIDGALRAKRPGGRRSAHDFDRRGFVRGLAHSRQPECIAKGFFDVGAVPGERFLEFWR